MAQIINNVYEPIDLKKIGSKSLDELFVFYGGKFYKIDDKIQIITEETEEGFISNSRLVKDVVDLKKNISKLCLYKDGIFERIPSPELHYQGFKIPSAFESTSENSTLGKRNEVPYGLERTLKVNRSSHSANEVCVKIGDEWKFLNKDAVYFEDEDGRNLSYATAERNGRDLSTLGFFIVEGSRKTNITDIRSKNDAIYMYVQVDGDWTFVHPSSIYWFDGTNKRTYDEAVAERRDLSSIKFFNEYNKEITSVYTEYEYYFGDITKKEVIDLDKYTKSVVSISDDSTETVLKTSSIDSSYSQQEFVKSEVQDETNPDKTKTSYQVKTINFKTITDFDEDNKELFIAVVVSDSLRYHTKLVKISSLVSESGEEIDNVSSMVGKRVKIKEGDAIVATTLPLTYEQANLRYDTVKTYQERKVDASENTCLRLKDGTYVKELESVQPESYKVAIGDDFDKYLVKQTSVDGTKWVVVDKDYFEGRGVVRGLEYSSAIKIQSCDFNDKYCSIIQTTSNNENVEQCTFIQEIDGVEGSVQNKKEVYNVFKDKYVGGEYKVKNVYQDGIKKDIECPYVRYEYTDQAYLKDHAEDLHQYKALRTENLSIKNGKMKGGGKFDIGKGISSSFSKLKTFLKYGYSLIAASSVFIPVVGPIILAASTIGVLVAVPVIPVGNAIYGAVKNRKKTYVDKTHYNRILESDNIKDRIKDLFEADLNSKQFEDEYSRIMNDILALSSTTSNNSLNVVNGNAIVNSNNVNLANKHVKEYDKKSRLLKSVTAKIEDLKKKGKDIPESLQNEFDVLTAEVEELKNSLNGNSYSEDNKFKSLKQQAQALKLYYQLTHLTGDELTSFLDSIGLGIFAASITYDANLGLLVDGLSIEASEKQIKKKFGKDEIQIEAWKAIKDRVIESLEKVDDPKLEEPQTCNVEKIIDCLNEIEEIYQDCLAKSNEITSILLPIDGFNFKTEIKNNNIDLMNNITEIRDVSKTKNNYDDLKELLDNIKTSQTKMIACVESANNLKEYVNNIQTNKDAFDAIVLDLEESNIIEKIKKSIKVRFANTLHNLKVDMQSAITSAKSVNDSSLFESKLNKVIELKTKLEELKAKINEEIINQDVNLIRIEIERLIRKCKDELNEIGALRITGKINSFIALIKEDINVLSDLLRQSKEVDGAPAALKFKEKATVIAEIISVSIDAIKKCEQVKSRYTVQVMECIRELERSIACEASQSFEELNSKLTQTKLIRDRIGLLLTESATRTRRTSTETDEIEETDSTEKARPSYDVRINSEDRLVVLLKAKHESKDRKKLIKYIIEKSGLIISEEDVQETIDRINEKHATGKNATANSARLANKNISAILVYGQQYLTMFAEEIKIRTSSTM